MSSTVILLISTFFLETCADPTPMKAQISPLPTFGRFPLDTVVKITCNAGYIQYGQIQNKCLGDRWIAGKTTCEGSLMCISLILEKFVFPGDECKINVNFT